MRTEIGSEVSQTVASRAADLKSQGGHGRAQHRGGQAAVSLH